MRILVAYATKRGGTRGLAEMITADLAQFGVEAELREARQVKSLDDYDAAIIGGSVYAFRWHRDAAHLVRKQTKALQSMPTWLFCSGPVGPSAEKPEEFERLAPKQMTTAAAEINARGTVVFGGRLEEDARGFIASKMAKDNAGDWRDAGIVNDWVGDVVTSLGVAHQ
jgi:menaquinone-dependent protoporphyrinogen oxidase